MKYSALTILLFVFIISCKSDDGVIPINPPVEQKEEPEEKEEPKEEEAIEPISFVSLNGSQLVDGDNNPIYLQGVAFNNFIWNNSALPPPHHGEIDYQRVKDMGMNAIRFYMNYTFFEDDSDPYNYRQSGWDWIDQNIEWAKENEVYLILNMHAPQGGKRLPNVTKMNPKLHFWP